MTLKPSAGASESCPSNNLFVRSLLHRRSQQPKIQFVDVKTRPANNQRRELGGAAADSSRNGNQTPRGSGREIPLDITLNFCDTPTQGLSAPGFLV